MDNDLFIRVARKDSQSPSVAQSHQSRKPTQSMISSSAGATTMPFDTLSRRISQKVASGKRRITIGGPRQVESHIGTNAIVATPALATAPAGGNDLTSAGAAGRSKRNDASISRSNTSTPSTRPLYPPTSWKSTTPVHLETSNVDQHQQRSSSTGQLHGVAPPDPEEVRKENAGKVLSSRAGISVIRFTPVDRTGVSNTSNLPSRMPSRRGDAAAPSNPVPSTEFADPPPRTGSIRRRRERALPSPEVAYGHTFHYTKCPHTSPPMSRPLNVQPTLVKYHDGLLACPPPHLKHAHEKFVPPSVHVLDGSCSDCDLAARRHLESQVLARYTHKLENLTIQMGLLQEHIVAEHPEIFPDNRKSAISMFQLPSTLELLPDAMQAVLDIEDQLNKVIEERSQMVKRVWRGFTERWGPGLRIHSEEESSEEHAQAATRSHSRTNIGSSDNGSSIASSDVPLTYETPEKRSVLTSRTSIDTTTNTLPMSTPSRQNSRATRPSTRTSSISQVAERYSDGTYALDVDSNVDNVKSRGRMVVDWIRPGRKRSESQTIGRSLSRRAK